MLCQKRWRGMAYNLMDAKDPKKQRLHVMVKDHAVVGKAHTEHYEK